MGDLPNIQAAYRFNDKNYLNQSQLVCTFLKGRGKLSYLNGTGPSQKDPKFKAWDEEDSMVMSQLWNDMALKISDTCMFLDTTKEVWDYVCETYSKVTDAVQIQEMKTKMSSAKHGTFLSQNT